MKSAVKVGVIGLGRFGRLHALTAAGLAECELVALVARRPAALDALAAELPHVRGWTNLDDALRESEAEAWIVACSTAQHVAVTQALLAADKKVLLEKPISDDLAEARSLQRLVRADSANLMLGHIVLFNSEFQQLCEEVARRGAISYFDFVRHRPASIVASFPGENPLYAAMVHDLYMAQVLMNRAEPESFSARYHRTPAGGIDVAQANLSWPGGTLGSFTASYLTPPGMPPRGFDRAEVFGSGWCARISPNPRPFELWDEQARWPLSLEIRTGEQGPTGMLAEEQRCFYRVVREQQAVPVGATYFDGLQVQDWMDRLASSARGQS